MFLIICIDKHILLSSWKKKYVGRKCHISEQFGKEKKGENLNSLYIDAESAILYQGIRQFCALQRHEKCQHK